MSTSQQGTPVPGRSREHSAVAVGATAFAAVLMIMSGFFQMIAGIVALVNDEFYVVGTEWVFQMDATTWGWIHLILGALVALAGFALFTGAAWARAVGVLLAVVAGVTAFAWLPWYPVWAIVLVAASVIVVWALTAHGRDIAD
ncbi:hypothetical protein [Isoptericola sp. BMS4]|uniref:DUF7144 family membrane protein n=1 Tax=Isoptericola sp. BMS4 TaxID=2527875 RepID=UPI00141E1EC5|nr:hypothetical protein [Isoptericola sp. BMS4]